ncbi:hypothetical protein HPB49_019580 [Dermacentor silvarum]|uniref:Uncharacterized protein n=1 Tax=Dermacentor silvarum TaxID=543639 RepID=A0ACB8D7Q2_DERSI|nr:hypothetical protein HPB49_019580 [Dermacentor silvarum]
MQCISCLLTEKELKFVFTRKFSSDPIESLFGFLWCGSGCNDTLDVKGAANGLEKMLKTGIVASANQSNSQKLHYVHITKASAMTSEPRHPQSQHKNDLGRIRADAQEALFITSTMPSESRQRLRCNDGCIHRKGGK